MHSPSTTTQHNFFFHNSHFWKLYVQTNFEIDKYVFILKMMHLIDNWWGIDLLCSPSTTQHNFCSFEISIFGKHMFKQFSKLTKMCLFWKWCAWEKIVREEIYCARLGQISTTFVFSKFAFLKIVCLNKFWNWQICIYFENDASKR